MSRDILRRVEDAASQITEGLALFNLGQYELAIETLPSVIVWDTTEAVPDGGVQRGRDEVLALWRDIGARWDDFRVETERLLVAEGVVLLLGHLVARGVGSGVPVETSWDQVWTVEDGLPVRCDNYSDRDRAWRASGLDREALE